MLLEIGVVLLLTMLNGVLAMSELAIVSAKPARLRVMAAEGHGGAVAALALMERPGRFLSTVQIGITLVGVLSGAVSGATLGARLTSTLAVAGVPAGLAGPLGVGIVVAAITYLSLIIGELVPKQIALRDAEGVAARVAPAMRLMSWATTPVVVLLDGSGRLVLWLLRMHGASEARISDEEIRMTIAEAESAGVVSPDERAMIAGVMRVADRNARALMTARRDVEVLDLSQSHEALMRQVRATRRSRLPVRDGGTDEIVGVIALRDLLLRRPADGPVRDLVREVPVVLDVSGAQDVIDRLRESPVHMVLVFDEHGHFEGIVTPMDVLEAITGTFSDGAVTEEPFARREDGSLLVAGWMPFDELKDLLALRVPEAGDYHTAAGYVLDRMQRIPALGDHFTDGDWRIEVIDLDGMRIDKLLVHRVSTD